LRFLREGWVDRVQSVTSDPEILQRYACQWLTFPVPGGENVFSGIEIRPVTGFLFRVSVGQDCEPLWLGLCRYPKTVDREGDQKNTKLGRGWRLAGFCKTQYASLRGWEHFVRCHCAVVHFLAGCRSPALRVSISDEGGYWPRRSLTRLRQNLDQMNGAVAAAAGAMKDAFPAAPGESPVQSPIFRHGQFERLEAAGAARNGSHLEMLRAMAGKA
jgi:hypothetical protein